MALKAKKLLLNDDKSDEIFRKTVKQINVENVATFYYVSSIFNISSLVKECLCYIERCFTMVAKTSSFLELDFLSIAKIVSSSNLHITSEIEVFDAIEFWLRHDIKERSKFSKRLLKKVRYLILSSHAQKYLFYRASCLIQNGVDSLEDFKTYNLCSTNRYYNGNEFNIIVCGGCDLQLDEQHVKNTYCIDARNFESANDFPPMTQRRCHAKAVCVDGEIYVFGGCESYREVLTVEKYSLLTKTWNKVSETKCILGFSVCAFTDKVYVIGGMERGGSRRWNVTGFCNEFDTTNNKWKMLAEQRVRRMHADSAAFEGKVVVCGGSNSEVENLNSVEAFDNLANQWSDMPNMVNGRSDHNSVAIKNKLFIIGGPVKNCEVFDSNSKKFTLLKSPPNYIAEYLEYPFKTVTIGNTLVVFGDQSIKILLYDIENNYWSEKKFEAIKNIACSTCAKLPQM